jgi:hypothetical protein
MAFGAGFDLPPTSQSLNNWAVPALDQRVQSMLEEKKKVLWLTAGRTTAATQDVLISWNQEEKGWCKEKWKEPIYSRIRRNPG